MFEFIEHVVYINLACRTDRKAQIESELFKYFPAEKVVRFDALRGVNGCVGCSKSHIRVLEIAYAKNWKNVLILEDDATWDPRFDIEYPILEKLMTSSYDVICLGAIGTYDSTTRRIREGQTRTAYLVSEHYYKTLLTNMRQGLSLLLANEFTAETRQKYCGDQYWKHLQVTDNWFLVRLMYQRKGFSDICGYVTDYEYMFQET